MKPAETYGLIIEPVNRYGTDYIEVRIARREDGGEAPLGCSADDDYQRPKHLVGLCLDGLGMYGFVTEGRDPAFIASDAEFKGVHSAGIPKLKRMLKALTRVTARVAKDNSSRDAGDKFMSLAAALKLSFAVVRRGKPGDTGWHFMTIPEGRNRYRELIDEAVDRAKAKLVA